MSLTDFNKFQEIVLKYIPDELKADDDYVFVTDCLGEIRRNYVLKHKNKNEKRLRKNSGKDF